MAQLNLNHALFHVNNFDPYHSTHFAFFSMHQVVSVVLENYGTHKNSEKFSSPEPLSRVSSWRTIVSERGEINVPM